MQAILLQEIQRWRMIEVDRLWNINYVQVSLHNKQITMRKELVKWEIEEVKKS